VDDIAAIPEANPQRAGDAAPSLDLESLQALESTLDEVERALARLDEGTYGRCEVCGEELDDEQLSADPAARHCRAHLPIALG
jgi:RNA polymerase-binding transcription factor DksA